MILENQLIRKKWSRRNRDWYESKGYEFTDYSDSFNVKAEDLSPGSKDRISVRCDFCGETHEVTWKDFFKRKDQRYACINCMHIKASATSLEERQNSLYLRAMEFCSRMNYILETPKEDITSCNTRIKFTCPVHGTMDANINKLVYTQRECKYCASEKIQASKINTTDKVEAVFEQYGGVLLNKDDYKGWEVKNLEVICPDCGKVFLTSYGSFRHGKGQRCPDCTQVESHGEFLVRSYLENNNIRFEPQYRFSDCRNINPLPFDFYLPELNTCIEFDGAFHYEPITKNGISEEQAMLNFNNTKIRDSIKTNYCKEKGIHLIRIPYWEMDNIQKILDKEINIHTKI